MSQKYSIVLLITLPCVLYANALSNSFHYDDFHTIVNNPHVRAATLPDLFLKISGFFSSSEYYSGETHRVNHYRPLLYATYVLNHWMNGLNPLGFRVVNLFLHIGCVILVYLLAVQFFERRTAFVAALIFAIHPLFSETVNYISARSSVLATFFYLLAFFFFIEFRHLRDPGQNFKKRVLYFSLFSFSMLLALLSKEIALTLPLVLITYDLLFMKTTSPQNGMRKLLPYLPLAVITILVLYKINILQYFKDIYITSDFTRSYLWSILAQLKGLALITGLFLFPLKLSIEHSISPPTSFFEADMIASFIVLGAILVSAFLLRHSLQTISFFLFWFFLTSLPTTVVPLNIPLLEHRGYLPGVGFSMILGWALHHIFIHLRSRAGEISNTSKRSLGWTTVFYGLIFLIYGGLTLDRNTTWKDPTALWLDAVSKSPGSDRAWANLGLSYLSMKDHQRAFEAFDQARLINPKSIIAKIGLGSSYHLQGQLDQAIQLYQDAIFLYPDYFLAHFNLGVAYQQLGHFEEALKAYQEAVKINQHHPETHLNLGSIYFAMDKKDLAIEAYQVALRLDPELAKAHYNLAVAYEAFGQAELANRHYREAERLKKRDE